MVCVLVNAEGLGTGKRPTYKDMLIEILGSHCNVCGEQAVLLIHHKDKNPQNNELENLQLLCRKCHGNAHTKPRPPRKPIKPPPNRSKAILKLLLSSRHYTPLEIAIELQYAPQLVRNILQTLNVLKLVERIEHGVYTISDMGREHFFTVLEPSKLQSLDRSENIE